MKHHGIINIAIAFSILFFLIISSENKTPWYYYNPGGKIDLPLTYEEWDYSTMSLAPGIDIDINNIEKVECKNNVLISIIDTEINRSEVESVNYFWEKTENDKFTFGWNFVSNSDDIFENREITHATKIYSLLTETIELATLDSEDYIHILNCVVYDKQDNSISAENIINAIKYSEEQGASICCLSLNLYKDIPELYQTIENSKMLFVVAAGNDGLRVDDDFKTYPASYGLKNVISVGNICGDGNLNSTSNYGNEIDVAAPGTDLLVDLKSEDVYVNGTSFAVAFVVAEAATLMTINQNEKASSEQIKEIICYNVNELDTLNGLIKSRGTISFYKAINYMREEYAN